MSKTALLSILGLLLIGATAALFYGSGARSWAAWTQASPDPIGPAAMNPAPVGVRKCVAQGKVFYTDADCPGGSASQAVSGGALTVLPSQPLPLAARSPAASSSAIPTVRQLLQPDDGSRLREQRMDRIIGQ